MTRLFTIVLLALSTFLCSQTLSFAVQPESDNPVADKRYFNPKEKIQPVLPKHHHGQIYYVDCKKGNDSWDGKSPSFSGGSVGPFKTIHKATDRYSRRVKGGNVIRIKAGIYRERVNLGNVKGAVSEETRFIIEPYGDGEVIVDASDTHLLSWSHYPANHQIYVSDCDLKLGNSTVPPTAVVMDDNFKSCRPVYRLDNVTSFGRWYYDSNTKKLYVHSNGTPPPSHDIIVVKNDRNNVDYGIYLTGNYITVYGLTVRGAASYGIHGMNDYNRVEKCTVKYSGKAGIKIYGKKSELLKNHVYGNVILNWPRGNTWDTSGGWPNGMSGSSFARIAGNIVHDNGGEGIGSMGGAGGVIIEDNISYDNWSVNIYLDNQPNDIVRRNLVYCSGVKTTEAVDSNRVPGWTNLTKIYKRMRPEGIMTGDEKASNPTAQSQNHQIYNNIIINCAKGYSHYGQATGTGLRHFLIANNTIIMPRDPNLGDTWIGLNLPYQKSNFNTIIKNNVVIGFRPDTPLVRLGDAKNSGLDMDNNLYFNDAMVRPFQINRFLKSNLSFEAWKMATGNDLNSIYANPHFVRISSELINGDYHLRLGSPAIWKGNSQLSGIIRDDFGGILRQNNKISIGALEYEH